jgi:translation elongation factor EF-4
MNELQKKCLKKAIKLFCNLPVNDWYIQHYIDKITIGYHSVIIDLDQYDIQILVKCETLINGKPILDVSFIRSINGKNEQFDCYETAYNFVPIDMPDNYIYSGK